VDVKRNGVAFVHRGKLGDIHRVSRFGFFKLIKPRDWFAVLKQIVAAGPGLDFVELTLHDFPWLLSVTFAPWRLLSSPVYSKTASYSQNRVKLFFIS
jgi:hypothetical protein